MTQPPDPRATERDLAVDSLVEGLDRAARAADKVLLRWLLEAELPVLSASALLALGPDQPPASSGEVARAIGVSVDDAIRALHELSALGYVSEDKRAYRPTASGRQVHDSLASARRGAFETFVSALGDDERAKLADALRRWPGQPLD